MDTLGSFAFKDHKGNRLTFLDGYDEPMDNAGLAQVAKDLQGYVRVQPGAVDQERVDKYVRGAIENDLLNQYPDDLDKAVNEANKAFDAYKGVNVSTPAIQAATPKSSASPNSLKARKERLKDQSKGTRMASDVFNTELSQALVPWNQRERQTGDDIWMGQDARGFEREALKITDEIRSAEGNASRLKDMQEMLINEYGHGAKQAYNEVQDVLKGDVLTTLKLGVPNAAADEGIGAAILRGSGVDTIINNQGDPITATDYMGRIGSGELKGIDAARQFNQNALKIGMFQQLPRGVNRRMEEEIMSNPDKKLGVIIDMLNNRNYSEDKFMHSLVYNKAPGRKLQDEFDTLRKDYLMSADMRGFRQNAIDSKIFTRGAGNHGSYNPVLANDYRLLDLNMARDELLNTQIGALNDKGYRLRAVGGKNFAMYMPNSEVARFSNNDLLDKGILQEVNRRVRRR